MLTYLMQPLVFLVAARERHPQIATRPGEIAEQVLVTHPAVKISEDIRISTTFVLAEVQVLPAVSPDRTPMTQTSSSDLAALIRTHEEDLMSRWRSQVRALPSARDLDVPTRNDHIPGLLEELAEALEAGSDETIA